jgi:hypothetical protein
VSVKVIGGYLDCLIREAHQLRGAHACVFQSCDDERSREIYALEQRLATFKWVILSTYSRYKIRQTQADSTKLYRRNPEDRHKWSAN